jgi:hypothetical protein
MDMSISKKRSVGQLEPFEKPSFVVVDGNVRIEQAYLLSSVIVVRSSTRPFLLSNTKFSMHMCQSTSNECTFFIYGNQI